MKEHKLAAIVFTDIVGYTKQMEADEEATMKLLSRQREILFPLVKEFGGEVIKEIGDGLLMMFTSANRAVRFAMAVQETLQEDELTIRAGIHIGDVIFEGGDVFGSAVNIAARIEPLAPAGGICISEDVKSQIRNQKDILTSSIGKKDLKGVDQEIEIYCVVSEEMNELNEPVPFFKDLWQRRVFQVIAIYMLFSYLIKMGMEYVVDEYLLSPHLTSLVWYILLALIPSIILVSYFHGRKGVSKWKKIELIGLPVNIVVAILIMVFVFKGKDLGAITTTLTVQNEEGESVEKLVVKNEFRKRVFIFNIDNISGDTALDYLQLAIPDMIEYDLGQDLLITVRLANDIYSSLVQDGYEWGVGVPVMLKRKYADERHLEYFTNGSITKENGVYRLKVELYETRLTRLLSEITVKDSNLFKLIDKFSVELKKAMGLPESHIDATIDLPLSDIYTDSESALRNLSLGINAELMNDWENSLAYYNRAIEEDPEFAVAYVSIALASLNLGDMMMANDALNQSVSLRYTLPERQQFIHKYLTYVLGQQPDKALTVAEMWAELYPDDLMAHGTLAQRYTVKSMFKEAVKEYKILMQLEPEQYDFIREVGDFYLRFGNLDSSLKYYELYAQKVPQEASPYRRLGAYYSITGDMKQASLNYNKAMALADDSEQILIKVELAQVYSNGGEFEKAFQEYLDALSISGSALDSTRVLSALDDYYLLTGRIHQAIKTYDQYLDKFQYIESPKDLKVQRILGIGIYIESGMYDLALEILQELQLLLEPPLDKLTNLGYMQVYAELGEVDKAREAMAVVEEFMKSFGEEVLVQFIYLSQARIHEHEGEYMKAIDNYNNYLEINQISYSTHTNIARCYRHLSELKKAEEEILISLESRPYDPIRNYEAAMIYRDMGKDEKARDHLNRALKAWSEADEDYKNANDAKDLQEALSQK